MVFVVGRMVTRTSVPSVFSWLPAVGNGIIFVIYCLYWSGLVVYYCVLLVLYVHLYLKLSGLV